MRNRPCPFRYPHIQFRLATIPSEPSRLMRVSGRAKRPLQTNGITGARRPLQSDHRGTPAADARTSGYPWRRAGDPQGCRGGLRSLYARRQTAVAPPHLDRTQPACRIAIAGIANPSSSDDIGESHRSCALAPLQGHTSHNISGCGMKTRKVRSKVGTFRDWCQASVGAGAPAAGTVSMVTVRSFSRSSISVPSTFHSASPQLTLALNGSGGTSNSVAYSVMCCWPR